MKPTPYDRFATEAEVSQAFRACQCQGLGFFQVNVPVGHRFFGKAISCVCQRSVQAKERAQRLRIKSGLSEHMLQEYTFESFYPGRAWTRDGQHDEAISEAVRAVWEACKAYASKPDGWLVITGSYGTGKTHLAAAIAGVALQKDLPVYFSTISALLDFVRASYNTGNADLLWQWIVEVKMLILDDLGAEYQTDWALDKLTQLVDYRYINRLPMVVTTNEDPLRRAPTSRLWSRLCDGAQSAHGFVRVLTLPCGDFRPRRMEG
ncbi:MAG: ATP-binding protein [Chloroflexi bacterium]|nr:ATP-binding protein [Chloroflexota bacterium]